MIGHAAEVERNGILECDVCIVGGGAAGITLARELTTGSVDTILLESGGHEQIPAVQDLNTGATEGAPQWPLRGSRLRLLGGTTNHWSGSCRPLDPIDFEARDWIPDSGWPITRADLESYYARAHALCELGPYDYGPDSWGDLLDPGPELSGVGVVSKLIQHGKPTRFGQHFRADLESASRLRVVLDATVTQLELGEDARALKRVEVRDLAGNQFYVQARRYVLACGGIENARALLLSDGVEPRGVGNANDMVGRYFMDHPAAKPLGALLFHDKSWERLAARRAIGETVGHAGLSLNDEEQRRYELVNHAVYMRPAMSMEEALRFRFLGMDVFNDRDAEIARFLRKLGTSRTSDRIGLLWLETEQVPSRDSRITLTDELDALGQRRALANWRPPTQNQESFAALARLYPRLLGRADVGHMKLWPWLVEEASSGAKGPEGSWWPNLFPGGWHQIGTTRMADTPERGVVDSNCRIFGVDNLYVAGSSVFPTAGYVNPTLTIMALALRLADRLRTDLESNREASPIS